MKPIEITLPNKNPTILFPNSITSIVFQPKKGNYNDIVIIGVNGWSKPLSYEGEKAKEIYKQLKDHFLPTSLKFDS